MNDILNKLSSFKSAFDGVGLECAFNIVVMVGD